MKRSLQFILALAVLTLTLPCNAYATVGTSSAEPITLSGYVIDESNGASIAFAKVTLRIDGAVVATTRTDNSGAYFFANVPPDRAYEVSAEYFGQKIADPNRRARTLPYYSTTPWVNWVPGAMMGSGRLPM